MTSTPDIRNTVYIYNTETQKKEKFEPVHAGEVRMYVCGPTVYDFLHVGNFRGAIFFNLVRNWFEKLGYKVTYVYNYTDVDDKIIKRANEEGVEASEITKKYIAEFEVDFNRLGLKKHDHNPRVTEFMPQIVSFIEKLVENKKAYVVDGEVLYSVQEFKSYGRLSHKNLEDLQSGIRVEVDEKKQSPLDFALWKPAKSGEPHWPSPWGDGRPGWHIECSVMATEILGPSIDIHGGGIDLIFPHHENEIAQSEGVCDHTYVKYWMHNNFLNFGDQKMSKSLGNVKTARAFMDEYHPEIMKYMYLRAHYRSLVDFSVKQIADATQGLARIYSALALAEEVLKTETAEVTPEKEFITILDDSNKKIVKALCDDFATPTVVAEIYEVIRYFNSKVKRGAKIKAPTKALAKAFRDWVRSQGELMALFQLNAQEFLVELDDMLLKQKELKREDINKLVEDRNQARANKDFSESDRLRDELVNMGISLQDTPQGTFWEVQK